MNRSIPTTTLGILALCAATALAEPLAVFETREITGRDWPRTLVTYELSGVRVQGSGDLTDRTDLFGTGRIPLSAAATAGNMRLVDASTGDEVPFQLWDVRLGRKPLLRPAPIESARISFYAELPAGGSYRYELHSGKPDIPITDHRSPITAAPDGNGLTLDNGIVALRLPAAGERTFDPPLRFAKDHAEAAAVGFDRLEAAGLAFGPVAGIRLHDGTWVGGSYFAFEPIEAVRQRQNYIQDIPADAWERAAAAAPRVTGVESRVTEEGPLFVEAVVRFSFDNGGHYQLTARVLAHSTGSGQAGDPAVRIDEVMELKSNCPPDDPLYVEFVLGDNNWQPDALYGWRVPGGHPALSEALVEQGFKPAHGATALAYTDDQPVADFRVTPWIQCLGLVNVAELAAAKPAPWQATPALYTTAYGGSIPILTPEDGEPPYPTPDARFLAVVPRNAGSWRQADWVFPPKNPHMFQHLYAYPTGHLALRWWLRPQPHSQNLLHTGEFDPAFGLTGMRRLWNLVAGPFQYHDTLFAMRAYEGFITLDNYKDWTLVWDEQTRAGVGLPVPPGDQSSGPLWHMAMTFRVMAEQIAWGSHYRQAQFMDWVNGTARQLANPEIPDERKGLIRAQVAAFCELVAEPDFNSRASALHQGNPNMPINRFFALPYAARLIPDHPKANLWLDVSADYLAFKAGMNTAPGGAWSELISYYGASHPTLVSGALVCRLHDRLDDGVAEVVAAPLGYLASLLSPRDPRFGVRGVPAFGHEGYLIGNYWTPGVQMLRASDPELATLLAWTWDRQGRPVAAAHGDGFADQTLDVDDLVEQATPAFLEQHLRSVNFPGFGAVLRDRPGTDDELYFAFRQGYLASHSDANQGDFVLYAHSVPLTTMSVRGYPLHQIADYTKLYNEFGWHSRVRFGEQSNYGGWPGGGAVSGIHRHFFSDSVDYLKALGDYPSTGSGQAASQRWTRQVLFLKSRAGDAPVVFVFRDSFRALDGDPASLQPKWWYQRTLGTGEQVQTTGNGFTHTSEWGPRLHVASLQPATVAVESRSATVSPGLHGAAAEARRKAHPDTPLTESMTINALGPVAPGEDILIVMTPLAADEAPPQYEALADGVARITTAEGTDIVFAAVEPFSFAEGDVAFEGVAGAVRIYPDAVHLIVAEGTGTVTYKGYTLNAGQPTTKIVPLAEVERGGTVEAPAEPVTIAFALDPKDGVISDQSSVISVQKSGDVTRYAFDSATNVHLELPVSSLITEHRSPITLSFTGRRGGIEVNGETGTVRLVMLDGEAIGYGDARVEFGDGPYDVTFHADQVVGVSEGPARLIHVTMPKGLTQLPALNIDGVRYAPGTHDDVAIIPVEAGRFEFTLENLPQPPVFRNWLRW